MTVTVAIRFERCKMDWRKDRNRIGQDETIVLKEPQNWPGQSAGREALSRKHLEPSEFTTCFTTRSNGPRG